MKKSGKILHRGNCIYYSRLFLLLAYTYTSKDLVSSILKNVTIFDLRLNFRSWNINKFIIWQASVIVYGVHLNISYEMFVRFTVKSTTFMSEFNIYWIWIQWNDVMNFSICTSMCMLMNVQRKRKREVIISSSNTVRNKIKHLLVQRTRKKSFDIVSLSTTQISQFKLLKIHHIIE